MKKTVKNKNIKVGGSIGSTVMSVFKDVMEAIACGVIGFGVVVSPFVVFKIVRLCYSVIKREKISDSVGNVINIASLSEFDEQLSNSEIVIADFYATWCPPCKKAAPIFADLSEFYSNIKFVKIDVDTAREVAVHYKITSLPTFKIFEKKSCIETISGFNEKLILEILDNLEKKRELKEEEEKKKKGKKHRK